MVPNTPGDQIRAIEDGIAPRGSLIVGTSSRVSVRKCRQEVGGGTPNKNTMTDGTTDIPKNPFDGGPVRIARSLHELTNLVDNKREITPSNEEVLQPSHYNPIHSSIIRG
jgi:hypothetical protein